MDAGPYRRKSWKMVPRLADSKNEQNVARNATQLGGVHAAQSAHSISAPGGLTRASQSHQPMSVAQTDGRDLR